VKKLIFHIAFFSIFTFSCKGQEIDFSTPLAKTKFYEATHFSEKLNLALGIINYYGGVENDTAQKWIYIATDLNNTKPNDAINYYLQIWQTEVFYYTGLYQFGVHSADLQIEKGLKIKDSFLIASAYFFKAINLLELDSFSLTKINLDTAIAYYPLRKPTIKYKKLAYHNQLINVYAETFFEQKLYVKAMHYNNLALAEAYAEKSRRGIPAAHLVQGKIFYALNNMDSAIYHFSETIEMANQFNHYDLMLVAYGKQMIVDINRKKYSKEILQKGLTLIDREVINNSFKVIFYKDAINVCTSFGDVNMVQALQSKLLNINEKDTKTGNELIQNITAQMVENENNLLKLQIDTFEKKKRLSTFQLIASLLFSVIMLLFFLLIQRRNRAKNMLLQQKANIARDLHDDIGGSLSGIKVFSQLAADRPESMKEYLTKVNTYSNEVISKMNDIVWTLNINNDSFESIMERIKKEMLEISVAKNILLEFNLDEKHKAKNLAMDLRKNVYLIAKEAINNAIKYAACRKIEITLTVQKGLGKLIIVDDGVGFNKQAVERGNGLTNMQNRAREIKGNLAINSSNGSGTIVELHFNFT
jgi:signal transduction histidine kinase